MTLYTVSSKADMLTAINSAVAGDTIQISADAVIDEFVWPKNFNGSLSNPITVRSANISRPGICRGIAIGNISTLKGNFTHLNSATQATTISGLVFDGILFYATRYTTAKDRNGDTTSLIQPDGEGLGWRVCGTTHPSGSLTSYSENANWTGIKLGSGTSNITFQNCTWNGYANAINTSSRGAGITIKQCDFVENCEDYIKLYGFSGMTIEWNIAHDFRGADTPLSHLFGFEPTKPLTANPPHADFVQQLAVGSNLTIRYNYLTDLEKRVHFALIRHGPDVASGQTDNVIVHNNESWQNHPTGIMASSVNNLTLTKNKIASPTPLNLSGPVIAVGPSDGVEQACTGTLILEDNLSTRIAVTTYQQLKAGVDGNAKNNDRNTYPSGWTHIRQDKVTGSARFAGPYGNDGGVIMPTKPPKLTNVLDAVMVAGSIQDPGLANTDTRRTGVIQIRKAGLAGAATEVRWQKSGDTNSDGTKELTADATYRYFRMSSISQAHLLYPGNSMTVKVQYVDPAYSSTAKSDWSDFGITVTVDAVEGSFTPTNEIEFPLTKGLYTNNQTVMQAVVGGATWNKPAPAFLGSGTNSGVNISQPNAPTAYASGDYVIAFAHKATAATIVPTGTSFLTTEIFNSLFANGQGLACFAGFASGANGSLGAWTSTCKTLSLSYRRVNATTPYYASVPVLNASAAGCAIPGITIPTNSDDNYRLLVFACNVVGSSFTTPTGYRRLATTGTGPLMAVYEKLDPVRTFGGMTIAMSAATATSGFALALKLA